MFPKKSKWWLAEILIKVKGKDRKGRPRLGRQDQTQQEVQKRATMEPGQETSTKRNTW